MTRDQIAKGGICWGWGSMAMLLLVIAIGCDSERSKTQSGKAAIPVSPANLPAYPAVKVVLSHPEYLKVDKPAIGGDRLLIVPAKQGQLWVLASYLEHPLLCASRNQGSWTRFEAVGMPGWRFVECRAGVVDASGMPVIFWVGFDQQPGEVVGVVRRTSDGWSAPRVLDRLPTANSVGDMECLMDAKGVLHLVYDRPLEPRESYTLGWPLSHGEFPNKCFHIMSQGQGWTLPQATTGRGKFDPKPLWIGESAGGQICLLTRVGSFADGPRKNYLGQQVWNGKTWGPMEEVVGGSYTAGIADRWGTKIGCRLDEGQYTCKVSRRDGIEIAEPLQVWGGPILRMHPSGRVLMYGRDDREHGWLRIWNGTGWSPTFSCLGASEMAVAGDGTIILGEWQGNEIVIQQIDLQEVTAPTQPVVDR